MQTILIFCLGQDQVFIYLLKGNPCFRQIDRNDTAQLSE